MIRSPLGSPKKKRRHCDEPRGRVPCVDNVESRCAWLSWVIPSHPLATAVKTLYKCGVDEDRVYMTKVEGVFGVAVLSRGRAGLSLGRRPCSRLRLGRGVFGVFFLRGLRISPRRSCVGDLVLCLADMLARVLGGMPCRRYCFAGVFCLCAWPVCFAILVCFSSVLHVPVHFACQCYCR